MGSGIALVVANCGYEVTLFSRKGKAGLQRFYADVQKGVVRQSIDDKQASNILSRVKWSAYLERACEDADLVLEAVVEDLVTKRRLFKKADSFCKQDCILASNTSSLSITSLAESTKRVDRIVGMHFFNPAPLMKLIEVVQTCYSSRDTINSVIDFSKKLGKEPLIVADTPGFVVNRILMPMVNSAVYALMDKVATAETIDRAMYLGANHPLGPLALADYIGIDICAKTLNELYDKLKDPKYRVCPLLNQMVREGNLGRKTGKGFFIYNC